MRLPAHDLHGLLSKPSASDTSAAPRPYAGSGRSGRAIARDNEVGVLRAVAQFGHLRVSEVARAVWPQARYAEQLARRTIARLVDAGCLAERRNALGSRSLCLTRVGAARLELHGIEAQHTLDLSSVSGGTFLHRTLATRYLVERQVQGCEVAGEYQLLRRQLPFSIEPVTRSLRKLPDGLVWRTRPGSPTEVEWIEQEAAAKARPELERCLGAAELVGRALDAQGRYRLGGVVFVYDRDLNHAKRVLVAATALWGSRPQSERVVLERRVRLVAVELRDPLVWVGCSTTTVHDLRQRGV